MAESLVAATNDSATRILGARLHVGRGDEILTGGGRAQREDGSPFPSDALPLAVALAQREATTNVVIGVRDEHGKDQWLSVSSRPLGDSEGADDATVVCSVSDITDRKQLHDRLAWEARNDPLTGLANRSGFLTAVQSAIEESDGEAMEGLVMFFFDLDRFKLVNDSLGHAVGDEVLLAVAERLRATMPDVISLSRLHGDEFAALEPNVTDTDADSIETDRADVLEFNPDGSGKRVFAWGIRNCVGEAMQPETGELWCSTNERDELGDNLPPDYITHVVDGGFYGWPWYYTGGNPDPRFPGKHPELRDKAIVPDVLLQPHNASLEMLFYEADQFPAEYHGEIFAAEHGSWNRHLRTGYEVIRVPLDSTGKATGEYEDFLTGFVTPQGGVWGRPVGVAVAKDGALLVSDDGSNNIWRVSYAGAAHH